MDLPIYAGEDRVGAVLGGSGGLELEYDDGWRTARAAFPASLSMPLDHFRWPSSVLTPWLMNLLPEGEPLRAMAQASGIASQDVIGLIAEGGRDVAGALSFGRPRPPGAGHLRRLDAEALEHVIEELPVRPFLVGEEGVSMSLAGAQDKLPVALADGQVCIPLDGAASTHILKPDNPRLHGSVANEALCMALAPRCGLPAAEATTGRVGARSYLLVTRYDRRAGADGVDRLHQEDFCQALARPPAAKYEHNGTGVRGPSLAEMFALVRARMTARDTNRLLDAVIFNIAIGNVDSHAKNYSILLSPGRAELAPLYDLMSGLAWPKVTQNHAQQIGGQRRGRHIYARHWRRLAEACGLNALAVVRRVADIAARIQRELPAAAGDVAAMPAGALGLDPLPAAIAERAALVAAHALIDGPDEPDPDTEVVAGGTAYDPDALSSAAPRPFR